MKWGQGLTIAILYEDNVGCLRHQEKGILGAWANQDQNNDITPRTGGDQEPD